jgi:hypothetical protein
MNLSRLGMAKIQVLVFWWTLTFCREEKEGELMRQKVQEQVEF